jgi:hypothetical protein
MAPPTKRARFNNDLSSDIQSTSAAALNSSYDSFNPRTFWSSPTKAPGPNVPRFCSDQAITQAGSGPSKKAEDYIERLNGGATFCKKFCKLRMQSQFMIKVSDIGFVLYILES